LWTFGEVAAPIYGLQAALSPLAGKQHPIIEVLARERTPLLYLLTGLSAVLVAPLAEEFFFRVLLQGWLEAATARTTSPEAVAAEPLVTHSGGLAIFTSALVFASMHVGHGADPIPLFFLALMLGYLYRRTHRLLPCVAVHFCLNACSYLMLCLSPTE
jgi:membrane protease YdiL (CAAX protease family)